MTAFVDTNVLIRHLTGDPPDLAARATAFLAEADELLLPTSSLLRSSTCSSLLRGARRRGSPVGALCDRLSPIRTLDPALLLRSLEVYETHRIDFAEAYLVASAEAAGIPDIISFDRSIDRVTTANRIEP